MKLLVAFITSVLVLLSPAHADGNKSFEVTGSVWLVKTSGTWELNNEYGYYRVVVTREGNEHARDEVYIQILNNSFEHKRTIKLETPGYQGYIKNVSFNNISDNKMAISFEIEMKGMYEITQKEVFIITPKGKVEKVIATKPLDL
ncbi:MAG: hypothetical protein RQ867_03930 [Mariprofundaceae bacterium]|nr:hypothetical protein [Mariprofundaceae bacterium]